jgi:hypothetical protein
LEGESVTVILDTDIDMEEWPGGEIDKADAVVNMVVDVVDAIDADEGSSLSLPTPSILTLALLPVAWLLRSPLR